MAQRHINLLFTVLDMNSKNGGVMKFVQFKDSNETEIIAMFSSEQSDENYSNLGYIDDDDDRVINFMKKIE